MKFNNIVLSASSLEGDKVKNAQAKIWEMLKT